MERLTHTESEVIEKHISCKGNRKKAEVAILIPDKVELKKKKDCNRRQIRAFYNNKEINLTRGYNACNIYTSNLGVPKQTKQTSTDVKGDTDSNTSSEDTSSRQKISKSDISMLDQVKLIDSYIKSPTNQQNTHSFQVHMNIFQDSPSLAKNQVSVNLKRQII